jgi:predicted aldo/keto reductase-like oxidoreductase
MKKINRREFFRTGVAGLAGLSLMGGKFSAYGLAGTGGMVVDELALGATGLMVPRLALGTGSHGGGRASNQTRLGTDGFVHLAHHAFDRGIRFFDMADTYGSHTYVKAAMKELPREKTTLLTKIWTEDTRWYTTEPVPKTLDRFRLETGSDYFDIVLMHCLMRGDWRETKQSFMDQFSRAKQDGIIKAVGVSCHNWDAMVQAVEEPWVDVILARINPFGNHMDNTPEEVMALLEKAKNKGKGIIGMKIFGNGDNVSDAEREQSISYAMQSGNVHSITLGMESPAQIDDAIERLMRNKL